MSRQNLQTVKINELKVTKNRCFILGKLIFIFFSFNSKLEIRNHLKYFQISY